MNLKEQKNQKLLMFFVILIIVLIVFFFVWPYKANQKEIKLITAHRDSLQTEVQKAEAAYELDRRPRLFAGRQTTSFGRGR